MFLYNLGDFMRHTHSGFQGKVTARADYLTGCNRYELTPSGLDKDGKPRTGEWFDEMLLEPAGKSKEGPRQDRGGPRTDPVKRENPR